MAQTVTYDPATGIYYVNGVAVVAAAVQAAAQAAVQTAQGTISSLSLQFQQGAISYQAWFDGMQIEIANMAAAQTSLAHGGFASMDAASWQRAVDVANRQLTYFDNFAAQVQSTGVFGQRELNRAAMYADAGRSTYENERMTTQKGLGATEAQRVLGASDSCFIAGTLIKTRSGNVPIERVESGDEVWTRAGWRRVLRRFDNPLCGDLFEITSRHGSVVCTGNHPFLTESGWVEASELFAGQQVVVAQNSGDSIGRHFPFPDSDHAVTASREVFVAGGVPFLLCDLTGVKRLESRVPVPPFAIGFDNETANLDINDEFVFDGNLRLKSNSETVKNAPQLALQPRRFVPLVFHARIKKSLQSLWRFCVAGKTLARARQMRRVIVPHSLGNRLAVLRASGLQFFKDVRPGFGCGGKADGSAGQMRWVVGLHALRVGISRKLTPNFFEQTDLQNIGLAAHAVGRNAEPLPAPKLPHRWVIGAQKLNHFWRPFVNYSVGAKLALRRLVVFGGSAMANLCHSARPAFMASGNFAYSNVPANWAVLPLAASVSGSGFNKNHYPPVYHVYNLEIEGQHEYVANGFLVHNCQDCLDWEALGWIPIEDMESDYPISSSVCRVNCFCSIVVR